MAPLGTRRLTAAAVLAAVGAVSAGFLAVPTATAGPATRDAAGQDARPYIVVLDQDPAQTSRTGLRTALDTARTSLDGLGVDVGSTFDTLLAGFAVSLDPADLIAVRALPGVDAVVPDSTVSTTVTPTRGVDAKRRHVQKRAPWGLDRIDQRRTKGNNRYVTRATGKHVTAFVVDTGILAGHQDFGKRVKRGFSTISGGPSDCNGHGTHVSGTLGGHKYGVAKQVRLVPVRVLNCQGSGTTSGVIRGLEWVARHAPRAAVVNMSLAGPRNRALNRAVGHLVRRGTPVVVAAGNEGRNACRDSPASAPSAITVEATNRKDGRPGFSNFGRCVDLAGPGVGIRSDWYTSPTATAVESGTSMASPHVAGVVALYLQKHPRARPGTVAKVLERRSTRIGRGHHLVYSHVPGA